MSEVTPNPPSPIRDAALRRADAKMVEAKRAFSLASLACLRNAPDAVARTRKALQLVEQARAEFARLADAEDAGS